MSFKQIIKIALCSFLFFGCQDAYQRQSVLNPIGIQVSNSAQRDVHSVSRTQNPMDRPSYREYQDSIEDKKFDPK